jgi:hypothetical protein
MSRGFDMGRNGDEDPQGSVNADQWGLVCVVLHHFPLVRWLTRNAFLLLITLIVLEYQLRISMASDYDISTYIL